MTLKVNVTAPKRKKYMEKHFKYHYYQYKKYKNEYCEREWKKEEEIYIFFMLFEHILAQLNATT